METTLAELAYTICFPGKRGSCIKRYVEQIVLAAPTMAGHMLRTCPAAPQHSTRTIRTSLSHWPITTLLQWDLHFTTRNPIPPGSIAVLLLLRVYVHLYHPKNKGPPLLKELKVLSCLTSFQEYFISLATALSGKALYKLAYSLPLSCTLSLSSPKDIMSLHPYQHLVTTKCPQAHTSHSLRSSESLLQL